MPDLNRCQVCNLRAELNDYGECPDCELEIGDSLLTEGITVRRAASPVMPPMRMTHKATKRGAA